MVDRDTLRYVLDMYLCGDITRQELSEWAYEVISTQETIQDPLVSEILFSLVGFDSISYNLYWYFSNIENNGEITNITRKLIQ